MWRPSSNLPPAFAQMQYADYAKIQPLPAKFGWREPAHALQSLNFYHAGMQFNAPVTIHEIVGNEVSEIRYDAQRFDFGGLEAAKAAAGTLGYAGFRVLYPRSTRPARKTRS